MNKRNYRFTLMQARLPAIYDEAEAKIQAGIKPGDAIMDLLIELYWRRQLSGLKQDEAPENTTAPETVPTPSV